MNRSSIGSGKPLLILLAVVMLLPGCAYFNTFYFARRHYQEAEVERLKAERESRQASSEVQTHYQRSLEFATRVLIDHPDSRWVEEAVHLSQKILYRQGELAASIQKGNELLDLFPESETIPAARLFLARARLDMGDPLAAMADAVLAIDGLEGRDLFEARFILGRAHGEASSFDEAVLILEELIEDGETPPELVMQIRMELQQLLAGQGEFRAAAEIVEDILDDPRLPVTLRQENLVRMIDLLFSAGEVDAVQQWMAELEKSDEAGYYGGVLKYFSGILKGIGGDSQSARNEMIIALITGVTRDWEVRIRLDLASRLETGNNPELACPEYRAVTLGIGDPEQTRQAMKRAAAIIRLFALRTLTDRVEEGISFRDPRGTNTSANRAPTEPVQRTAEVEIRRRDDPEQELQPDPEQNPAAELQPSQLLGDEPHGMYLFLLAEHLALEMGQPDSAMAYIALLEEIHPESDLVPRALYAYGSWLPDDVDWQRVKDASITRLLSDYPSSSWAYQARVDLGEDPEKPLTIRAGMALLEAEREVDLLAPPGEWVTAIESYRTVIENYPETDSARKAELGVARLLELGAGVIDSARVVYERIVARHPGTSEALMAAGRLGLDTSAFPPEPSEARRQAIAQEIGAWTLWFQTRQAARVTLLQPRRGAVTRVVVQQQQQQTGSQRAREVREIPPR